MNRQALRHLLRETFLDDMAEPYLWGDELLNALIEEAHQEAAIRSLMVSDKITLPLQADLSEYQMPDTVLRIDRVKLPEIRPLTPTSIQELDDSGRWEVRSGTPQHFVFTAVPYGGDAILTLYPKPDKDYEASIQVKRLPEPMLADADSPELPVHLQIFLLDWAAFRAFSLRDSDSNDEARAAKHEAAFIRTFGERHDAAAMRDRGDRRPRRIRMNSDYWG